MWTLTAQPQKATLVLVSADTLPRKIAAPQADGHQKHAAAPLPLLTSPEQLS